MSQCVPVVTLKPICFQFMPKTVIGNIFIVQVYWEAVPNMWPGSSKTSVTKVLCVCGTAHNLSVDEQS